MEHVLICYAETEQKVDFTQEKYRATEQKVDQNKK